MKYLNIVLKFLDALGDAVASAATILFIWYMLYHYPIKNLTVQLPIPPSGWWWFGTALVGVFLSNLPIKIISRDEKF